MVQEALIIRVTPDTNIDAEASEVVLYRGEKRVSGYGKLILIEHNKQNYMVYTTVYLMYLFAQENDKL